MLKLIQSSMMYSILMYLLGLNMNTYIVIFYIDGVEVDTLLIQAMDEEWAKQVLNLQLNTKEGIPSIFDYYTQPKLIK